MKKPLVAVVGRPNVGKSTFFNKIAGKRISIIKDEPGVTRDRIYADCVWLDNSFTLIDTGGIDLKNNSEVQKNIMLQSEIAISLADVILFFVDGKEGITTQDREVADYLRKTNKPIILVVNKLDNNEVENSYEFYELNLGTPFPISSEQSKGLGDLLDEVVSNFKNQSKITDEEEDKATRLIQLLDDGEIPISYLKEAKKDSKLNIRSTSDLLPFFKRLVDNIPETYFEYEENIIRNTDTPKEIILSEMFIK